MGNIFVVVLVGIGGYGEAPQSESYQSAATVNLQWIFIWICHLSVKCNDNCSHKKYIYICCWSAVNGFDVGYTPPKNDG